MQNNRQKMEYVLRTPQLRPSLVNAASQTTKKAANTSARNSNAESKEENGIPHAIVPTGTSEEKQLAADPLGDAGSKMQQEVGKEFSAMMASETVRAIEAAMIATNKVVQKYMHINVAQTLYISFTNIVNADHFMNILEDDISTIRELLDEYA
ncbi:hypothetical protein Tco_0925371 [Tanacetum coccineum]|uniref:Uncharacterized protein n=1 Tax=Tanacetum coccineum TaxID=301880 RepID=A0ABQ5D9A1_9ASTR